MAIPTNEWNEFRKENRNAHEKITDLLTKHDQRITTVETNQRWFNRIFSGMFALVAGAIATCFGLWMKGK